MPKIKVGLRLLEPNAQVPQYSKSGDGAMDLVATSKSIERRYTEYGFGLAMAIPEGYVGLVFPRSSVSRKDLDLSNAVGMIDAGYRGEVRARFRRLESPIGLIHSDYDVGDRAAQIIIVERPLIVWDVMDELPDSDRGEGGFGSTGS